MSSLLPKIVDRSHYRELFKQNAPWEPAIHYLIQKHGLKGDVQRGVLGSHIVYRVGDFWIKLMAPIFAGDMIYELSGLRAVMGKLSVPTPAILAEGELEGWPYVILSHIEGEPIRQLWGKLKESQKIKLTEEIAQCISGIGQCQPDDVIRSRFDWNEFIKIQYETWEEHQSKKGLPKEWLSHLGEFLGGFDLSEFQTQNQILLHADLTFDHFLVQFDPEPQISGIIDLADCQVGHLEYELVAPAVFIFKGEEELLWKFFSQLGYPPSQLGQKFSEKLLAWSILHRYFSMTSYFKKELDTCRPGDFKSLAEMVFPISKPGLS